MDKKQIALLTELKNIIFTSHFPLSPYKDQMADTYNDTAKLHNNIRSKMIAIINQLN